MELEPEVSSDTEEMFSFDVSRYLHTLRRYAWVVVALLAIAITGAVVYTSRQPRIYEAQSSVQIEPKLPDLIGQGQEILSGGGIGAAAEYYKQQKQVLNSYTLIRQTVEQHQLYLTLLTESERGSRKLDEQIELATKRLQADLSIKYPDQNRIMYVVVRSENPQHAADIANHHVTTYVEYARGLLAFDTKQASGALASEFDDTEKKLREAEASLYRFQKDKDLLAISLSDRQTLISASITQFTQKLNETKTARIELAAKLGRMREAAKLDVLESPILLMGNSMAFETLRANYYAERVRFVEVEKEVGPKHTNYQMQKAKVDELYNALKAETKRMLGSLEEQYQASAAAERALRTELESATKEALDLGPNIVAYNELSRRKKSIEDRYNILRTRLSASELTDRVNGKIDTSNVRPLDPALAPTDPVSPNLRINVLAASVIALVLGLALIVLIAFLDRSIKSTADAQQAAGVPVLGIVPMVEDVTSGDEKSRDHYVHENPKSSLAEHCRSLRTNIMFSAADRPLTKIVISSASPREGKTTCAIYLGTTMAQSNQRVLLVDTDMRRPRLHGLIGGVRSEGLSNLILGDRSADELIKATDIPNLFVLPCGPLPPNPAELLMSKRFAAVLDDLGHRFDRIILDSPPLQAVTDAVVLSRMVDGVILVVHAGKTLRDEIRHAANQIRGVGSPIFGVIVNASDNERDSYYYYGYGEKAS
ncbi:MAG: polysaccharide biosynthesis tyrosine autokinase [Deltaproteobacteria bacterium]|nr:polysaccharide biosynthesis tyrosine autokinase [Deltaproteobacteria bacterium]